MVAYPDGTDTFALMNCGNTPVFTTNKYIDKNKAYSPY